MSYDEILKNTISLKQDFYFRIKVYGVIGYLTIDNENVFTSNVLVKENDPEIPGKIIAQIAINPEMNMTGREWFAAIGFKLTKI